MAIKAKEILYLLIAVLIASQAYASIIGGFQQLQFIGNFSMNVTTLTIYTGNVSRVHVTQNGSVGIGTLTPQTSLHINGTGIMVKNSSGTSVFFFNASTGNAGIGTNTPGSELVVVGDLNVTEISYLSLISQVNTTGNVIMKGNLTVNNTVLFVDSESGRIGIGNASAGSYLQIVSSTSTTPSINIQTGSTPGSPVIGDMYSDGSDLFFYDGTGWVDLTVQAGSSGGGWTDDGAVVRLTTTSNYVGIGTVTPSEKLYVDGNGTYTSHLFLGGDLVGTEGSGPSDSASFGWNDDGTIVRLSTSTDLVGIGTAAPATTLHVNGSGSAAGFRVTNQSGDFSFFINASLGRVGINTLTPTQALDVNGHINVTGTSSNSSFTGDVKILGTLYGGSPLKVGGGINVSSTSGKDAFFVSNGSGVKIFRISDKGELNITSSAGNTSYDQGTLFVDAENNKVGIGTVNPLEVLTVVGNANISGMLNATTIYQAGNKVIDTLTLGNGTIIRDSNTSWVVAIGSIYNRQNFTADYALEGFKIENMTGVYANFTTLNVSGQVVFTSGNVGIGTTSPGSDLHVENVIEVGTTGVSNGVIHATESLVLAIDSDNTQSNQRFSIEKDSEAAGTTELFRVQEDGNVGIGTSTPTAELQVESATANMLINSSGPNVAFLTFYNDDVSSLIIGKERNQQGGLLGGDNAGYGGVITTSAAPAGKERSLVFGVNNTPVVYINGSNMNVGIGTTTPSAKLHVNQDSGSSTDPAINAVHANTGLDPEQNEWANSLDVPLRIVSGQGGTNEGTFFMTFDVATSQSISICGQYGTPDDMVYQGEGVFNYAWRPYTFAMHSGTFTITREYVGSAYNQHWIVLDNNAAADIGDFGSYAPVIDNNGAGNACVNFTQSPWGSGSLILMHTGVRQ